MCPHTCHYHSPRPLPRSAWRAARTFPRRWMRLYISRACNSSQAPRPHRQKGGRHALFNTMDVTQRRCHHPRRDAYTHDNSQVLPGAVKPGIRCSCFNSNCRTNALCKISAFWRIGSPADTPPPPRPTRQRPCEGALWYARAPARPLLSPRPSIRPSAKPPCACEATTRECLHRLAGVRAGNAPGILPAKCPRTGQVPVQRGWAAQHGGGHMPNCEAYARDMSGASSRAHTGLLERTANTSSLDILASKVPPSGL